MTLINLTIRKYEVYLTTNARLPWTQARRYVRPYYTHLVWGKFSLILGPYSQQPVTVCCECDAVDEIRSDRESGVSYCMACNTVEGETKEITLEEAERMERER